MKPSELRGKNEKELAKHVEELKESLFQMKMKKAAGALKQTAGLRSTKRDIAKILTILKERTSERGSGSAGPRERGLGGNRAKVARVVPPKVDK